MLKTTFARKDVCNYANKNFYAAKFDIRSKEDITFMDGKVYKKDPNKRFHDLAYKLLGDKPEAPMILLYNDKNDGFSFKGNKEYHEMICMMVYIAEHVEKTTKYNVWAPAYFRTFPPNKKLDKIVLAINWMPLQEALKKNAENPKGIFLTFFSKTNAASSVILVNAFSHRKVADYMNEHFYCVRLDAQTTDTLIWDKPYYNTNADDHIHELTRTLMKGELQFPSIFYFDGKNRLILSENLYLSPEALYILSNYVQSEAYKTKQFAEFMKSFKFEFNDIVPREHPNGGVEGKQ